MDEMSVRLAFGTGGRARRCSLGYLCRSARSPRPTGAAEMQSLDRQEAKKAAGGRVVSGDRSKSGPEEEEKEEAGSEEDGEGEGQVKRRRCPEPGDGWRDGSCWQLGRDAMGATGAQGHGVTEGEGAEAPAFTARTQVLATSRFHSLLAPGLSCTALRCTALRCAALHGTYEEGARPGRSRLSW